MKETVISWQALESKEKMRRAEEATRQAAMAEEEVFHAMAIDARNFLQRRKEKQA